MKKLDKTVLHKLEGEKLSKPELRFIVGGCGDPIDGGTLPEVYIICGQYEGRCWKLVSMNYFGSCRQFTGSMSDYCHSSMAPKCPSSPS